MNILSKNIPRKKKNIVKIQGKKKVEQKQFDDNENPV